MSAFDTRTMNHNILNKRLAFFYDINENAL